MPTKTIRSGKEKIVSKVKLINNCRKVASSERYFAKLRNGIALTFTLGLGFVVGFLPVLGSNDPTQVK